MRRSSRVRSKSARRSKIGPARSGGLAGAHHVDEELGEVLAVGGKTVGQGFAALEHAQHIQDDDAEGGTLGQLGGDGQGPVQRYARI